MSEPFLGEIRVMGFNFAPKGWAFCDGQVLPINQNQALYSLLGTTYGGDGRTSFALPDLRGRVALHRGDSYGLGKRGGAESVTLDAAELANHTHSLQGTAEAGDSTLAKDQPVFANNPGSELLYGDYTGQSSTPLNDGIIAYTGGGQAHNNMQPTLVTTFCIAIQGLFPSRN